jgi:phosphoglycerate dehydrogenase-like enzyme
LQALRAGAIAGAALDVLQGEPDIGPDHHLLREARENPRLLIVPHIGGSTVESLEKAELFVADKVVALLSREATIEHA